MNAEWSRFETHNGYEDHFPGFIGKGHLCSNAVIIKSGKHYNGSGDSAFGGAKDWPHIAVSVGFQSNEQVKAEAFAFALKNFVNEWLNK